MFCKNIIIYFMFSYLVCCTQRIMYPKNYALLYIIILIGVYKNSNPEPTLFKNFVNKISVN